MLATRIFVCPRTTGRCTLQSPRHKLRSFNAGGSRCTLEQRPAIVQGTNRHFTTIVPSVTSYAGARSQGLSICTPRSNHSSVIVFVDWINQRLVSFPSYSSLILRHQSTETKSVVEGDNPHNGIRLSKLIAHYSMNLPLSRREAERLIRTGQVTVAGKIMSKPFSIVSWEQLELADGKDDTINNTSGNPHRSSSSIICKVAGKAVILDQHRLKSAKREQDQMERTKATTPSSTSLSSSTSTSNTVQKNESFPSSLVEVWMVHKLAGELVSERDPLNRPCMMDRVALEIRRQQEDYYYHSRNTRRRQQQQQGRQRLPKRPLSPYHYKPIGRLDMSTEGLVLVTNNGDYAREMELPSSQIHRVYRARVHGNLTLHKLEQIRKGRVAIRKDNDGDDLKKDSHTSRLVTANTNRRFYSPMKVSVESDRRRNRTRKRATDVSSVGRSGRGGKHQQLRDSLNQHNPSNTWIQITATEGKNRQIRRVFEALGVMVSRLIRISYGDYDLATLGPGHVVQVPYKPVQNQRNRGALSTGRRHGDGGANEITTRSKNRPTPNSSAVVPSALPEEEDASPVQWLHPSQL